MIEPIKLNSLELLSIFIYTEAQKSDSKYKTYFDLLPKTYNCPVVWEECDIRELPFSIAQTVMNIKTRLEDITIKLDLDYDMYLWSFCSTFTRYESLQAVLS